MREFVNLKAWRHSINTLLLIALFLLPSYLNAANNPALFEATYKGSFSGWRIELVRSLTLNNDQYEFTSSAKNLMASMSESSLFHIDEHRLIPQTYVYERKVFGRKTTEKIDFQWPQKLGFYHRSDRSKNDVEHALTETMLDPSLYQLALQADIANTKKNLTYTFIKRKRIEHYHFTKQADEPFDLNKKSYTATVISRSNQEKNKHTKIWIIPELDYQIAKIVHEDDDGDTFEIELTHYQSQSDAVKRLYQQLSTQTAPAPTATDSNAATTGHKKPPVP